jgi:16S rRNA (guanine527-N7)-methyltransferase
VTSARAFQVDRARYPAMTPPMDAADAEDPPPAAPPAATTVFGAELPLAEQYAAILGQTGVRRGLLGPRELPRLWERHLLNSAVLTDLVPTGQRVVDVGTGAGLPGIAMAIRRADLRVDLVEPMLRRTIFLTEAVAALRLSDRVRVIRGRAEDGVVREAVGSAQWVVARAVAPLDRLVAWCLPLLEPGGTLLALKGASAADELALHRDAVRALGGGDMSIVRLGGTDGIDPTWAIRVAAAPRPGRKGSR